MRVDVAVVGRALDFAVGGAGAQHLDEERVQLAARLEPVVQLVGVGAPLVRVQGAQAGLLVDRVVGARRAPGERVGLDQRRFQVRRFQQLARARDRHGRVVQSVTSNPACASAATS